MYMLDSVLSSPVIAAVITGCVSLCLYYLKTNKKKDQEDLRSVTPSQQETEVNSSK